MHGKDVIGLDIALQPVIPNLILGDAILLPFKEGSFDAVVCMEVLEHLFEDITALQSIRRVLKDDGVFVLSVHFYHDIPEYHVRVHTSKTIRRLLEYSGFQVVEFVEKGGGIARLASTFPYLMVMHGLNLLSYWIFQKTFYIEVNRALSKIDWRIGISKWKFLHRCSKFYGAFIKCHKGRPKDFRKLNVVEFTNYMKK